MSCVRRDEILGDLLSALGTCICELDDERVFDLLLLLGGEEEGGGG